MTEILHPAHVEIALARWRIAQELSLCVYPELDPDAKVLELRLPE